MWIKSHANSLLSWHTNQNTCSGEMVCQSIVLAAYDGNACTLQRARYQTIGVLKAAKLYLDTTVPALSGVCMLDGLLFCTLKCQCCSSAFGEHHRKQQCLNHTIATTSPTSSSKQLLQLPSNCLWACASHAWHSIADNKMLHPAQITAATCAAARRSRADLKVLVPTVP